MASNVRSSTRIGAGRFKSSGGGTHQDKRRKRLRTRQAQKAKAVREE